MFGILLYILIVLSIIYLYIRVVKPHSYWKNRGVQFVKPWPIIGNMGALVFRRKAMANLLLDMYQSMDGRYLGIYQFLQPSLLIKDLELLKQIVIKDFDSFLDHRPFITEDIDPLMGKNLFSLRGQKWRNMRSILSPAFTGSKMRAMYTLISDCSEQFTNYFLVKTKNRTKPFDIEMRDVFTRFANDVIATCAFGIKCDSLNEPDNEFYVKGEATVRMTPFRSLKFFGYTVSPGLMKFFRVKMFSEESNDFFRNMVLNTMRLREKKGIFRPDMVQLLLEAKKGQLKHEDRVEDTDGFAVVEESSVGKQIGKHEELSDDDYVAQAVIFFIAGFDSVSTNMCHLANEMALNPSIQKRLQKEIDQAFVEGNGKISYEIILKLKYLDMCVSEGLRKWPPTPFTDRVCNKQYVIKAKEDGEEDLVLQKGDNVIFPIYSLHRDPKYFPNPDKFDPERFSENNKRNVKPMTYVPFGAGPRNCIGSRLGLLEIKTVLVHILRRFDLVVTDKTQIPIKLKKGIFNPHAEKGFWLGIKSRE